jgi:hypothetical protein
VRTAQVGRLRVRSGELPREEQHDVAAWALIAALLLAVLGLALASPIRQGLLLRRHVIAGSQHLQAAQNLLSGATAGGRAFAISSTDLDKADAQLAAAQSQLSAARSDLDGLSGEIGLLRRLPFIGGTAAAIPASVDFAGSATEGAQELVAGLRPLAAEREAPSSDSSAAARLAQALLAGAPHFGAAQLDLQRAQADRTRIHEQAVLPVLRGSLAPLAAWDRQWPTVAADLALLVKLPPVLRAVLGFNGPRSYAILGQNSAELRPTGGFLGSMGIVQVANGQIAQQDYKSIYDYDPDISGTQRPLPPAPQPIVQHLGIAGWHIEDANWSPDFPTSAHDIRSFLAYDTGQEVNGVIGFDSYAVQDLLQTLGPIDVTIAGQTQRFTADDWLTLSTRLIYLDPTRTDTIANKDHVLGPLLQAVLARVNSASGDELTALVQTLRTAVAERHILFQFDDSVASQFVADYAANGALALAPGETTLYPVESNLSYTKIGPFIQQNAVYELWFDQTGVCRQAQLRLTWQNTVTQAQIADPVNRIGGQEWDMATGKLVDTVGAYGFDERVYAPGGTTFISASGAEQGITQDRDGAFSVFDTYISIPAGQSHALGLAFSLPDRESTPGHFVLNLPNQPGTQGRSVTVIIHSATATAPHANVPLTATGAQAYSYQAPLNRPLRLDLQFTP